MALAFGELLFTQQEDGTIEISAWGHRQNLSQKDITELSNWIAQVVAARYVGGLTTRQYVPPPPYGGEMAIQAEAPRNF